MKTLIPIAFGVAIGLPFIGAMTSAECLAGALCAGLGILGLNGKRKGR